MSIQKISDEIGWEELNSRRKKHKLVLFYKMVNNIAENNIAPLYLSSLVPPIVQGVSHYNLRNANDLKSVNSRTTQYFNSFLPSVIRDWNSLPCADRNVETIGSFKRHLNQHRATVPKYFYTGNRKSQILHTRLRLGCNSLKVVISGKYKNLNNITKIKHTFLKFHRLLIFVILHSLQCKIEGHAV